LAWFGSPAIAKQHRLRRLHGASKGFRNDCKSKYDELAQGAKTKIADMLGGGKDKKVKSETLEMSSSRNTTSHAYVAYEHFAFVETFPLYSNLTP